MLRKHQSDMQRIAIDIRRRTSKATNILAHVTPGGGKSALPMILAKELAEPMGYKICWVVPRDSLRDQGETDFSDKEKQAIYGHRSQVRAASNEENPSRGHIGYVTTYQSIVKNPLLHAQEFSRHKYILFLDECHHVPFKGESDDNEARYYEAVKPLVELAHIRVFASGTLERHDGNKIAFLRYTRNTNAEVIDMSPDPDWEIIRYKREDALGEKAVVELYFHVMDGHASWQHAITGEKISLESIASASLKDQSGVLQTILETKYAYDLLDKCAQSWSEHKEYIYEPAKMLVVAPNIRVAKVYCSHLKGLNALIATSEDSDDAKVNIEKFKATEGNFTDVLVTVGMAYEGLDVPQITHVACLTNIRSRPWIEQCICRANRTTKDKDKICGCIFYPDEPKMHEIIEKIKKEQAAAIIMYPPKPEQPSSPGTGGNNTSPILPIGSGWNGKERAGGLEQPQMATYGRTAAIAQAMNVLNIRGLTLMQAEQLISMVGGSTMYEQEPQIRHAQPLPPSRVEKQTKKSIEAKISSLAHGDPDRIIAINRMLKARFGPRKNMDQSTLELCAKWLIETYGNIE